MADPVNGTTLAGALVAVLGVMLPRIIDRVFGRKGEEADAAESVGSGAGAVTAAAIALLDSYRADRDECRRELADQDERCRAEIAELRAEVVANRRLLEAIDPRLN